MTDEEYINHNGQFTNVRFERNSYKQMKAEIKHDLRMIKVKSVVKPDNPTILINYTNGKMERHNLFMKSKECREIGQKIIDQMEEVENRHRKLLRTNYDQSLNKERVSSFNMGVLTFSDSMKELVKDKNSLEEVIKLGIKTIENICKELDTKLHYISFHYDEDGIPHFHYYTDNFNSKGRTINPKRVKDLGKNLQDLGNKYFKKLGFHRGLDKSVTGGRHLSIQEYKKLKDLKKENEQLKKENEELKNTRVEAMDTIIQLVSDLYEMGVNYKDKSPQELLEMFNRYSDKKFDNLLQKVAVMAKKNGLLDGWEKKGQITIEELMQHYKNNNQSGSNKSKDKSKDK